MTRLGYAIEMKRRLKIYFDGGCRPNPGRMEAAVVVRGVTHLLPDLGHGTSTDAEWLALIAALRIAQATCEPNFVLIGDSANVIDQANRVTKCRTPNLQAHLAAFEDIGGTRPTHIKRIGRAQNLAGIALTKTRR
jgi:ribonuclease HI